MAEALNDLSKSFPLEGLSKLSRKLRLRASVRVRNDTMIVARNKHGWSQSDLAKAAGVSLHAVGFLEKLDYSRGDVEKEALKVAVALVINPDAVLPVDFVGCKLKSDFSSSRFVSLDKLLESSGAPDQSRLLSPDPVPVADVRKDIEAVMDKLPKRLKLVLCKYYGLFGESSHTYSEIGLSLNIGIERARQLVHKGLRILQHPRHCTKLIDCCDFPVEQRDRLQEEKKAWL